MAFSVTPTSGVAPYQFNVEIDNVGEIDNVSFVAEFRQAGQTCSCPISGMSGTNISSAANALVSNGVYASGTSVSSGQCRAYTFFIKRLADDVIVSESTVFVSNV
mgnify:CR=1 FL=1